MFSDTQHSGTAAAICVPNTGKISEEEAKLWESTSVPGQGDTFPRTSPGSWVTAQDCMSRVCTDQSPEPGPQRHARGTLRHRRESALTSSSSRLSWPRPALRAESSLLGWGRRRGSGDFLNPRGRLQISLQS